MDMDMDMYVQYVCTYRMYKLDIQFGCDIEVAPLSFCRVLYFSRLPTLKYVKGKVMTEQQWAGLVFTITKDDF